MSASANARAKHGFSPGKYLRIAGISLQTALIYPAGLVSGLGFYALFIYVFSRLWSAMYAGGLENGYTLPQMVWYLCVTELVAFSARNSAFGQMNSDIKTGAIAYQIARPYHYLGYQFAYSMGQSLYGLLVYGALGCVLALATVGPLTGFNPLHLPAMLLSLALGICLNFFARLVISLSAFFIEDNFGPFLIYNKLVFMLGTFLPLEMLPGWLQGVARWLPFSYVAWAPARLITRFSWPMFWQVVPVQMLWLAAAVALSLRVYHAGRRRLDANGG